MTTKAKEIVQDVSEKLLEALAADGLSKDARRSFAFALRATSADPASPEEVQRELDDLNPTWLVTERRKTADALTGIFETLVDLLERTEVLRPSLRFKLATAMREVCEVEAALGAEDETEPAAVAPVVETQRRGARARRASA